MDMGMKYTIWDSAHKAFTKNDYQKALQIYSSIDHLPQVLFNMASICIMIGNYDQAIEHLSKALIINKKFAIAYYQRGFCFFSNQKYQTAASDFSTARKLLKTKKVVDYLPAGLEYKLYMCELLYNSARCYFELDNTLKARVLLTLADSFIMTDSQALIINTSTKHIYSVEPGLQFIPELKLSTVGSHQSLYKTVLAKPPQGTQKLQRLKSCSESIHSSKRNSITANDFREDEKYRRNFRSHSMILHNSSSPNHLESSMKSKRNSILKIKSPEGNFMISLDSNTSLDDLKEKVSLKLRNVGSSHYEDLSLVKNGLVLKTDNDLKNLLLRDEIILLNVEKDVVDLYLDVD